MSCKDHDEMTVPTACECTRRYIELLEEQIAGTKAYRKRRREDIKRHLPLVMVAACAVAVPPLALWRGESGLALAVLPLSVLLVVLLMLQARRAEK